MTYITANLIEVTREPMEVAFQELNANIEAFRTQLEASYSVDWDTGATQVDEAAVFAAAAALDYAGGPSGTDLVATLNGGFAVIDSASRDGIPWRTLSDPDALRWVSKSRLKALGVADRANAADLLRARHITMPAFVDTAVLVDSVRDRTVDELMKAHSRLALDVTTMAGKADPGDGGGKGGGAGGSGGGGVPPITKDMITQATEFVANCLPKVTSTTVSATVGVGVCFDRECALTLSNILLGGGGSYLITAVNVAIKAGELAALGTLAGGWVGLIVAICITGFAIWLRSVTTSNGACIHFPWWAGHGPVPFGR